jgi:hypothetical protein
LNAVNPANYAGWRGELLACEADADAMAAIATATGFQERGMLKTGQATRQAVTAGIRAAATSLQAGDIFLLTYSGHGGQVPDANGDEDEGLDETWCLFDGQLLDDELYVLWQAFRPGVRIQVCSDSCHSGSVTKALPPMAASSTQPVAAASPAGPDAPRVRAMPDDVVQPTYAANAAFYDGLRKALPATRGAVQATVRLLSGCQDYQKSLDGPINGAFTAALLKVWSGGAFVGNHAAFHAAIVARMPRTQKPNHFVIGAPDPAYDAQRPFTV